MLFTVLISVAVALVIFAIANKKAKKTEQPTVPTIEEEPLGYETSSLASVVGCEEPFSSEPIIPEIVEEQPKPKAKKKMSAKPKAPKKKKDA